MAPFGKKESPDERKLRERTPELQRKIDDYLAFRRGEFLIGEERSLSFKAIMSMTSAEKQELERLASSDGLGSTGLEKV